MSRVRILTVPLNLHTDTLRSVDWRVQQELHIRLDTSLLVPVRRAIRITLRDTP